MHACTLNLNVILMQGRHNNNCIDVFEPAD